MALTYSTERKSRLESRARARAEYRMIFALSFVFFLIGSALARAIGVLQLPFIEKRAPKKSLINEARDAANSVLPYAFMG